VRCRGWATLSEHKWSSFGERRGFGWSGGPIGGNYEVDLIDAEQTGRIGDERHFEVAKVRTVSLALNETNNRRERTGRFVDGSAFAGGELTIKRSEAGEPDVDGGAGRSGIFRGDEGGEVLLGGLCNTVEIAGADGGDRIGDEGNSGADDKRRIGG